MLSRESWTTVAHETYVLGWRKWQWCEGHDSYLRVLAERDEVLLMHRRNGLSWDLVARLPGPMWQRMARRRRGGR